MLHSTMQHFTIVHYWSFQEYIREICDHAFTIQSSHRNLSLLVGLVVCNDVIQLVYNMTVKVL